MSANLPLPVAHAPGASQAAAGGPPHPSWPAEAIRDAVAPLLPGFAVEVLPEVDSTNSELMRRARAGRAAPVLLVAQRQTAGRGRLGRDWDSRAGAGLTFSLGLVLAPTDWWGLSLAVGVSLAESLDSRIRLKWPNDLWLDDRKLAGILIETATAGPAQRYAVVGVGINLDERPSTGLSTAPAWLGEVRSDCEPGAILLQLAEPLVRTLQLFEREGFAPFKARFDARDALRDRAVVLSDGTSGWARGTTGQGALRVETERGIKALSSSEVSVRPRA